MLALATAITLVGAGCAPRDPLPKDKMAARVIQGILTFDVCDPVPVNTLSVSVLPFADLPSGQREVWRASKQAGETSIGALGFGQLPDGFIASVLPESLDFSRVSVTVEFARLDSVGSVLAARSGVFDGRDLSADFWIDQDGDHATQPCK